MYCKFKIVLIIGICTLLFSCVEKDKNYIERAKTKVVVNERPKTGDINDESISWSTKYNKKKSFRGWKYIVIHHSATDSGNAAAFHKYHTDKGYGGLAYHFVIGNGKGCKDGKVEVGFRWKKQITGTHCSVRAWEYNIYGIGICLVGNFSVKRPTKKQMKALYKLVLRLMKENDIQISNIVGHKEVVWDSDKEKTEQTSCPGKLFDMNAFRKNLRKQF